MKYRPEIDGLRALAVIPVILFHAGIEFASGGYVGVDVFFVISGYLITSIIITEMNKSKFSLLSFYERRAKRILPALFFYLSLSSILAFIILPPHLLKDFGQSLFANSIFLANIFFYIETEYFNDFSETAMLLHTWSLSVEEQYYLFFPLVLIFFKKFRFLIISMLTILSLFLAELLISSDSPFSFYMLPTRFWELGIGSLISIYSYKYSFNNKNDLINDLISAFGLLLIIIPVISFDKFTKFPGINALFPVIGTSCIIIFSTNNNRIGKLLSNQYLVNIGLISYSLYLSHHLVISSFRLTLMDMENYFIVILALLLSILLALFSYKFVELPIRKSKINTYKVFLLSIFSMIFISLIGFFIHKSNGMQEYKFSKISPQNKKLILNYDKEKISRTSFWNKKLIASELPFKKNNHLKRVLILGDSKSEDFYIAATINKIKGFQFRRLSINNNCNDQIIISKRCKYNSEEILNSSLLKQSEIVILSNTWHYLTNKYVLNFIKKLSNKNKEIYIVSTSNFNDASSLSYVLVKQKMNTETISNFFYKNIREDWRRQYLSLKKEASNQSIKIKFLEKLDVFCNLDKKNCQLFDKNGWYIWDSGHLTINGAIHMNKRIRELKWFFID